MTFYVYSNRGKRRGQAPGAQGTWEMTLFRETREDAERELWNFRKANPGLRAWLVEPAEAA